MLDYDYITVQVRTFCFKFIQGGLIDNFQFQMDDDTEVYQSCSAILNGQLYVLGGSTSSQEKRKQV